MLRKLIVMVFLGSLVSECVANQQPSISGIVLDSSGSLLGGATVIIVESGVKTVTDTEGRFSFSALAPGNYTLRASAEYFKEVMKPVSLSTPGTEITIVFTELRGSSTQLDVIGEYDQVLTSVPGSAFLVGKDRIQATHPSDTGEILRRVPGLHVVDDSGPFSMRLNLGVRGLNPDRSRKLLVLEDGVPLALAPYGEPEMYYSPPIDRMHRVEVLKGSGSILFGPQTVGGVVNFVTPDPPRAQESSLQLNGGNNGYFVGQASWGNTIGRTGILINYLRKQGDGFRSFQFDINDFTAKIQVDLTASQRLSFKFNTYDEGSNSTYLGLTVPQYRHDPGQNSVPDDFLAIRRYFGSANHQIVLGTRAVVNTTFFAYNTVRNWRRQDFDRRPRAGRSYLSIEGDPSLPEGAVYLRDSAGHRNRQFNVFGIESRATVEHRLFGLANKLEAGGRFLYEQADEQFVASPGAAMNDGVLGDLETRTGKAGSFYIQNRFLLTDRIVLTPGLRLEKFNYDRHILLRRVNGVPTEVDIRGLDRTFTVIPGIGLAVQATGELTLFTGAHRGFAPPRVKDAIDSSGETLRLDAEESINLELGARYTKKNLLSAEATFFSLDFKNQIIPASQSAGQASFGLLNAGKTLHRGIEFAGEIDLGGLKGITSHIPVGFQYTYLPISKFVEGFIPSISGNRLPYSPKHIFGGFVAYRPRRGLGAQLDLSYIHGQFSDPNNIGDATAGVPARGIAPSFNGQTGAIPAYALWNLSIDYTCKTDQIPLVPFISIKNLANRNYIASRAPEGIQPGWPRQVTAGIQFRF